MSKRHSIDLSTVMTSIPDDDEDSVNDEDDEVPLTMDEPFPVVLPNPPSPVVKRERSCSLGSSEKEKEEGHPRLIHGESLVHVNLEKLINNESLTPLVINRTLYREHRQIRLAVLDASKRLEDMELRHIQKEEHEKTSTKNALPAFGAGLVMKRGHKEQLSKAALKQIWVKKQKEQQALMDKSNRQAGRGRRNRKKTVSDMSGMLMVSPPSEKTSTSVNASISDLKQVKEEPGSFISNGTRASLSCPPSPALNQHEEKLIKAVRRKGSNPDMQNSLQNRTLATPPSPAISKMHPAINASPSWPPPPPL